MVKAQIRFSLIGHKGRCFDVRRSFCEEWILSASEDSTAKLWNLDKKKTIFSFHHDDTTEVLRAAFLDKESNTICTCTSSGLAVLWKCAARDKSRFENIGSISHGETQIYACESVTNQLLTASENQIHFWDLSDGDIQTADTWDFELTQTLIDGTVFGGPRNPDEIAYVFDAKPQPESATVMSGSVLIAVALSDGTVRFIDRRAGPSHCPTISVSCPDNSVAVSHVTSVAWSSTGDSVVAALGSGDSAVLDTRSGTVRAYCRGAGRACFGGIFHGDAIATWSSDGLIRIWGGTEDASGIRTDPTASYGITDFPIYTALALDSSTLLCGGGTGGTSFLGTPVQAVTVAST